MPIQPGDYDGEILTNDIRAINGKEYVLLMVKCSDAFDQQTIAVKIWLTPKAIGMARGALKLCGFDINKDDLAVLAEDKVRLAGRVVPVVVEDQGKYGLQGSVKLDRVGVKRLGQLTQALRTPGSDEPSAEIDKVNEQLQKLTEEAKTATDEGIPF